MDWYVNELKPYVDDNYPTLPQRRYTFISGSSMGGLMTLYALLEYNRYFSRGAVVSPAVYFSFENVREMIRSATIEKDTILYIDYGEKELFGSRAEKDFRDMVYLLQEKRVLLESRIVPGGIHSEITWEKQLPFLIDVLFYEL